MLREVYISNKFQKGWSNINLIYTFYVWKFSTIFLFCFIDFDSILFLSWFIFFTLIIIDIFNVRFYLTTLHFLLFYSFFYFTQFVFEAVFLGLTNQVQTDWIKQDVLYVLKRLSHFVFSEFHSLCYSFLLYTKISITLFIYIYTF